MKQDVGADARNITPLSLALPIVGVAIAIAATTAMDVTGLFAFSAFALLPLMFLFWYLDKLSCSEMGFRWGKPKHYGMALLYPLLVIGIVAAVATVADAVDLSKTNWSKALLNLLVVTVSTALLAIVTEEGFFRGWLWGSLRLRGVGESHVLIYTSIAFSAWHISAVTLDTDYKPAPLQVPVFLINAAVIGMVWGMLRWMSGSIVVTSLSHGLWNGIAYVFFGFGAKTGALGIRNTAIFGPEIGVLGLITNAIFAVLLWQWWRTHSNRA
jgi:membrane protease YdiL (CAAX protease family)